MTVLRGAIAAIVLALLIPGCAFLRGVGGPREFADEPATEPAAPHEVRYDGPLRVPLVEEWGVELPDIGVWALSRFEMGRPLVDGERLLLGSSRAPGLRILDRRTGRTLRTVETINPVQSQPVLLGDDRLLLADTGGYVYLTDRDGALLWRYHAGGPIYETPVHDGERIYAATTTDVVVAIAVADGSWLWSYRPEELKVRTELSVLGSTRPVVRDGKLYVGLSDGRLVCLDAASGAVEWEIEIGEGRFLDVDATPRFTDEGLLVTGSYSGPVVAVDVARRAIAWRFDSGVNGDLLVQYGRVTFADEDGELHCLDAVDGSEQWSWRAPGPRDLLNTPVAAGRILVVAHNDGTLFAIDAFAGTVMWRHEARTSYLNAACAPVIEGRQLLLVTGDGMLRSFRAPPGTVDTGEDAPGRRQERYLGG